jgi:hypothetical protein
MRTLILALSLALFAGAVSAADAWRPFDDPNSKFATQVPATPTTSQQSTTAADGSLIVTTTYEIDLGNIYLAISDSDFTKTSIDPGRAIDGAVNGVKVAAVQTELDQASALDGQPGHELIFSDKNGNRTDYRNYFAGGRLYQVLMVTDKDTTADQMAMGQRFLSSFQFTGK